MENIWKPERTSRVLQPEFRPKSMSVSNLSPTMHILEVEIRNLRKIKTRRGKKKLTFSSRAHRQNNFLQLDPFNETTIVDQEEWDRLCLIYIS